MSDQTLVLAWLNRNRKMTCRLSGAFKARWMIARTRMNVFPEREPPRSMMFEADEARSRLASTCFGVSRTAILRGPRRPASR